VKDDPSVDATDQLHAAWVGVAAAAGQVRCAGLGLDGHAADVFQKEQGDRVEVLQAGGDLGSRQVGCQVLAVEGKAEQRLAAERLPIPGGGFGTHVVADAEVLVA
jgi:hypothetical protein